MRLLELRKSVETFRQLFSISRLSVWAVPAMVALGLLASFFEGLSLALIIPLLQVINDSAGAKEQGGLLRLLHEFVELIPIGSRILAIIAIMLGAVIVKSLISYGNMALLGRLYGHVSHALRTSLFAKIVTMPLAQVERERAGRLLNALNVDTWRATDAMHALFSIIVNLTTLLVLVALLLVISWQLTLIALLCVSCIPPLIHLLARKVKKLSGAGLEAYDELTQRSWSAINGMRVIHAFGREEQELSRFRSVSDRVRHVYLRMALVQMTTGPVTEVLIATVLATLALLVEAAQVAVPTLVGFLAILYRLQPRALSLAASQTQLKTLHANVAEVSNLLSSGEHIPVESQFKKPFTRLREGIRFEHVSFTYPDSDRFALRDVSFHIRRGGMVAVVGASGAGKSTLLDLLLRFHKPQQGIIRVDGVPLNDIDTASWRAAIGVVGQDPYIFDDTVKANILYGKPDASFEEIKAAARFACADDFIQAMPKGYDTVVGERGAPLSGGQRQRLALARALLRNPDILLLDEATNALDLATERAFQEALGRFAKDRTVIVVAHRLSMIERADFAIVLEDGAAVQEGPPHTLLGLEGAYARLFRPHDGGTPLHLPARNALETEP